MPVLDRLVSISTGLVPEPALCPDTGAAERSQETLYELEKKFISSTLDFFHEFLQKTVFSNISQNTGQDNVKFSLHSSYTMYFNIKC